MANYYDRNYDRDWERRRQREYDERQREYGYGGREGRSSPSRYYYQDERDYARNPGQYEYDEGSQRNREFNQEPSSSYSSIYGARPASYNRYYERTYRPPYYGRDFNRDLDYDREDRGDYQRQRGWWDRASDEIASWFGDQAAEQRRRADELRQGTYRGRGPRAYQRSDERIKEDINDHLTDHDYLDAYDVEVAVNQGEVTLSGRVSTRRDKRLAEDIAESVSGVKNVQNNLRVGPATTSEEQNVSVTQSRAAGQR